MGDYADSKDGEQFKLDLKTLAVLSSEGIFSKKDLKIKDIDLRKMYDKAKQLYNLGKYCEAQALFSTLTLLDRAIPGFLYGLGISSLMLEEYDFAVEAFTQYSVLVPEDPVSYYYASVCYMKKNDITSALNALQSVVAKAGMKPEFKMIKNRALLEITHLSKKISSKANPSR
jgi:type III secretion system low calcium response chaperone LcrH/SycD